MICQALWGNKNEVFFGCDENILKLDVVMVYNRVNVTNGKIFCVCDVYFTTKKNHTKK